MTVGLSPRPLIGADTVIGGSIGFQIKKRNINMLRILALALAFAMPATTFAQEEDEQLVRNVQMILTEAGFNDIDASTLSEAELTEIFAISDGKNGREGRDQIEEILPTESRQDVTSRTGKVPLV